MTILAAEQLDMLTEAGRIAIGQRRCESVDGTGQQCRGIVRFPEGDGSRPESPYRRFCYDCLIYEFGKGD